MELLVLYLGLAWLDSCEPPEQPGIITGHHSTVVYLLISGPVGPIKVVISKAAFMCIYSLRKWTALQLVIVLPVTAINKL